MRSKSFPVMEAPAKPYVRGKAATGRRALNVSIRADLVDEARANGLNLSRFLEEKLDEALHAERGRRWREQNREAIEFHKRRIERDGMWNKDLVSF